MNKLLEIDCAREPCQYTACPEMPNNDVNPL
jgi:hypothetical protein